MMKTNNDVLTATIAIAALCTIGHLGGKVIDKFGYHKTVKELVERQDKVSRDVENLAKKVNTAVDDVMEKVEIEIEDSIVQAAVEKAVAAKVADDVKIASNQAVEKVAGDIKAKVSQAVNDQYKNMEENVRNAIDSKVHQIDISAIKREVTNDLKRTIEKKLDEESDMMLDDYKKQLKRIAKAYERSLSETKITVNI